MSQENFPRPSYIQGPEQGSEPFMVPQVNLLSPTQAADSRIGAYLPGSKAAEIMANMADFQEQYPGISPAQETSNVGPTVEEVPKKPTGKTAIDLTDARAAVADARETVFASSGPQNPLPPPPKKMGRHARLGSVDNGTAGETLNGGTAPTPDDASKKYPDVEPVAPPIVPDRIAPVHPIRRKPEATISDLEAERIKKTIKRVDDLVKKAYDEGRPISGGQIFRGSMSPQEERAVQEHLITSGDQELMAIGQNGGEHQNAANVAARERLVNHCRAAIELITRPDPGRESGQSIRWGNPREPLTEEEFEIVQALFERMRPLEDGRGDIIAEYPGDHNGLLVPITYAISQREAQLVREFLGQPVPPIKVSLSINSLGRVQPKSTGMISQETRVRLKGEKYQEGETDEDGKGFGGNQQAGLYWSKPQVTGRSSTGMWAPITRPDSIQEHIEEQRRPLPAKKPSRRQRIKGFLRHYW